MTDGFDEDTNDQLSFNAKNSILGLSFINNQLIHHVDWPKQFPMMNRFDDESNNYKEFSTILSSPLRSDGKSIGNITFERINLNAFSSQEIELIAMLSENVSKILDWIDIHNQLNRSASRDGLTGLLNHKTFISRFEKELDRSARFDHHLGLIFFDIDKFKSVNDNYGHQVGSKLLIDIGEVLKNILRQSDHIYRYGGDEFVVIMPNVNVETVHTIALRVLDQIKKKEFDIGEGRKYQLSLS